MNPQYIKYFSYVFFPVLVLVGVFFPERIAKDLPVQYVPPKEIKAAPISLLQFGDMMFDRNVRVRMQKGVVPFAYMNDFKNIFREESGKEIDFTLANLEGPIIETARKNCQQKAYTFQFPLSTAALLHTNGIDLVSLSNNHSYDCYKAGIESTRTELAKAGVGYFGGGNLAESYTIRQLPDTRTIAFVGIDETIMPVPLRDFYPLITKLKSENDYVVVNIHWGREYELIQSARQTEIAHTLVDAGADIIFGHHPHVVQPVETYKGRPIFYSLGNFIFDQIGVEENKGLAAGVVIDDDTFTPYSIPFVINESQPKPTNN